MRIHLLSMKQIALFISLIFSMQTIAMVSCMPGEGASVKKESASHHDCHSTKEKSPDKSPEKNKKSCCVDKATITSSSSLIKSEKIDKNIVHKKVEFKNYSFLGEKTKWSPKPFIIGVHKNLQTLYCSFLI